MRGAAASLLLWAGAAAAQGLPPLLDEAGALHAGWRVATLPDQKPPVTRFSAERVDGRAAVRIEARASYGNLVHEPQPPAAAPRTLAWSWRVLQPNRQADLRLKPGDDSAVKLCLSFDLPLDRVPFVERQLLKLARARSGQHLPAATLCWAWGHAEAVGRVVDNPYSRRVRTLVLRNAADGVERWVDERRDVAADFRRAFGDEAAELPPLLAVGVAGDADNTGAYSVAQVAGLQSEP